MASVDDYLTEFYIDGVNQVPVGGWPALAVTGQIIVPARTRVIAVKVTNTEGSGGFLASSTDGSILSTGWVWKARAGVTDKTWMLPSYNDSSWRTGYDWLKNDGSATNYEPQIPRINRNAYWVWTSGMPPADYVVFFRMTLYKKCK